MPTTSTGDREHAAMGRALELARRGPAHGPNPRVGCVLLAPDGRVLGEGWHRGAGTPHAEVAALADAALRGGAGGPSGAADHGRGDSLTGSAENATAPRAADDVRGATAVVTLEPCNHTGRTGPCAQALLDAGVARVVVAVPDPNPVATGGAQRLRAAGVDVTVGVREDEGRELLGPWLAAVGRGRPYVTLKTATTLDGRVAAADGTSRWITSAESRRHAHAVRAEVDAIVVGTGTALTDDPSLTARDGDDLAEHQPLRVVVGERDLPGGGRLHGPGGELVHLRTHDPAEALAALAAREVRHILVEGGPTLAAAFLRAGLVDEVHAYLAPVLLGAGASAVGDLGVRTVADAVRLAPVRTEVLGPDVLLVARPERTTPDLARPSPGGTTIVPRTVAGDPSHVTRRPAGTEEAR